MARIAMTQDLAELIGPAAEYVENRSLLLDKFAFHKNWPVETDSNRRPIRWDDASRWSFVRISSGARAQLMREAQNLGRAAQGRNASEENRARASAASALAKSLANVAWENSDGELSELRAKHTRRFVSLFHSTYAERAVILGAQLEGRLAINLADSLIQNAGICLDRLTGLPFIPGSAVKGVARHAALRELNEAPSDQQARLFNSFREVFGTSDSDFSNDGVLNRFRGQLAGQPENWRGRITFLPAHPIQDARIGVDVTTVHYPDYYRSGETRDLANERPMPNAFPVVEAGAKFAFCLVLNRPDADLQILSAAKDWLEEALVTNGIGAKTASGYGWFSLQPQLIKDILDAETAAREKEAKLAEEARIRKAHEEAETARVAALSPEARAKELLANLPDEQFANFAKSLKEKSPDEQRAFVELLQTVKKERWKIWKKKKPELANPILEIAKSLNLNLA